VITRSAETPASVTSNGPAPRKIAAAIARAATAPICKGPVPMANMIRSAIASPKATPKDHSTARRPVRPAVAPRAMTVAIGATNGCS
jgi:hypothetical protein